MPTTGEKPGWIFGHDANLGADGSISVRGGQNILLEGGKQKIKRSIEEFALDVSSRNPSTRRLQVRGSFGTIRFERSAPSHKNGRG
jgi:hypothetical protein